MVSSAKHSTLLQFEDLSLPSVIVMTANMGCAQCRKKVSGLISKIIGLRDYVVDVSNKQVIVKADFGRLHWNVKGDDASFSRSQKRKDFDALLQLFKCCLSPTCFSSKLILVAD